MAQTHNELERQIEAAFDYRGHITLNFHDGSKAEGYLFNRDFGGPASKEPPYVELILKEKDERKRIPISSLKSVELTGKDYAETFEEGRKRTANQKLT